jgi:hypothetical protein
MIVQFSGLNAKRNTFLHGLWYTHESGRVFLSESAVNDFHYWNSREVKIEELEEMDKEMRILSTTIMMRRSPSLARLIASPQTPQQPPVRRNKKEYRQSIRAKRSTPPQSSEG